MAPTQSLFLRSKGDPLRSLSILKDEKRFYLPRKKNMASKKQFCFLTG
jgi:hypothetical protein